MLDCPTCKARMKPLFTSFFCPNDCDRPVRAAPPPVTYTIPNIFMSTTGFGAKTLKPGDVVTDAKWPHGRTSLDGAKVWAAHVKDCKVNGVPSVIHGWYEAAHKSGAILRWHKSNCGGVFPYGYSTDAPDVSFALDWCIMEDP